MITFFNVNGLHVLRRRRGRARPASRTSSPRSTCAASTTTRSGSAPTMSTSSSADRFAPPDLFAGRRVLVTGGTSGIGAGVARGLRRGSARECRDGRDRRRRRPPPTASDARSTRARRPRRAAVAALVAGLPASTPLVNCAGIIRRDAEHDPAVFADVLDVNLTGTMRTLRRGPAAASPRPARIVTPPRCCPSSAARRSPRYPPARAASRSSTKSLAVAYARRRDPRERGRPGLDRDAADRGAARDRAARATRSSPAPRSAAGASREDSSAPRPLPGSAAARFVTGEVLRVDGGYLAA